MNDFFDKVKKLERKHLHELALMCGGMAVLVLIATFVGSGIPTTVYAWTIYISNFTNTPVVTGGYTTLSWYAGSAQFCTLSGPTLPCTTGGGKGGGGRGGTYCAQTVYGTNPGSVNIGNIATGPITGPTSYTLSCYSPAGCSWWCNSGSGSASLTVYPTAPTPTTLTAFYASPTSVTSGNTSILYWDGSKGTSFSACELVGGQWGSGTWFTNLPDHIGTNPLSPGTYNYSMDCFDTTGASTGWRSATVTATAPVDVCQNILGLQSTAPANGTTNGTTCSCNGGYTLNTTTGICALNDYCSDIPNNQPSVPPGCVTPVPPPGSCIPVNGSYSSSNNACSCPVGSLLTGNTCVVSDLCTNFAGPQTTQPANSTQNSDGTCSCSVGYAQSGSSCVVSDLCTNFVGPQTTQPANSTQNSDGTCSCSSGYVQPTGGASCVLQGSIVSFTASPSRVLKGNTASVSWSTSNMSACTLSSLVSTGSATLSSQLSATLAPVVNSKTIFTLTCSDASGASYSASATVNLIPQTIEQ